jgi:hypothetical protein
MDKGGIVVNAKARYDSIARGETRAVQKIGGRFFTIACDLSTVSAMSFSATAAAGLWMGGAVVAAAVLSQRRVTAVCGQRQRDNGDDGREEPAQHGYRHGDHRRALRTRGPFFPADGDQRAGRSV